MVAKNGMETGKKAGSGANFCFFGYPNPILWKGD